MSTSILPLVLGTAVLGQHTVPGGPAPETIRVHGECWRLVTDPAAIVAASAAEQAQFTADQASDAAASAMAEARYAPRIASRAPTAADGVDKPVGAGWLEYNAAGVLVQMWRWTGSAWSRMDMSPTMIPVLQIGTGTAGDLTADRITVTGAFAARVANIIQLNASAITAGTIATARLNASEIAAAVARVIELDADRITAGTIDTARLNASAIAAAVATIIQLNADRITTGTLDTARLNANSVAAAVANVINLNASRITAGTIATARLNASEIAAAVATIISLNASRITAGTLSADRIAANSITSAKILVDGTLAAQIVNAMTVATKRLVVTEDAILNRATIINGLAADVVSAATIYANQLVVSALDTAGNLKSGTVGTVQIVDGAVNAAKIHAEEVAGAIARFLTIEVGQLVAGTADIDSLVAQKIAGATASFQQAYIQNLRTNGAVIDEAVIGELAANIITSGLFRTAESGQRLEIDSNGITMLGVDSDGIEFEMVRIGPSGANLVTVGSSVITPDTIQSPSASFDQVTVGGDSISDLLNRLPRGIRVWGQLSTTSQFDSNTAAYARRGELQGTLEPGRLYRVALSEHHVEVQDSAGANTNVVEELRYALDGATPSTALTPPAATIRGAFARSPAFFGAATTLNGMTFMLNTGSWTQERDFSLIWMMRTETAARAVKVLATSFYAPLLTVEDVGPAIAPTLKRWNDGNGGTGTVEAPDPEPVVVRKTQTWDAASYGGDTSGGQVYQGTYSPYGNRWGGWVFYPAMRTALQGSTIEKFEVYLYAAHWYDGSGGTAVLYGNDGTYKGVIGSGTTSANWPRNAGRWVTVPSSWHAGIQNGTVRGVSVYTTNTSPLYYGRFTGSATKFRATFRR